jgi:hypothetical protein
MRLKSVIPAEAETLSDSTLSLMGMRAFIVAAASISGEQPSFSLPKTISRRSGMDGDIVHSLVRVHGGDEQGLVVLFAVVRKSLVEAVIIGRENRYPRLARIRRRSYRSIGSMLSRRMPPTPERKRSAGDVANIARYAQVFQSTTTSFLMDFNASKPMGLGVFAMAKMREILSFSKSFLVVRFATSWTVASAGNLFLNSSEMTSFARKVNGFHLHPA